MALPGSQIAENGQLADGSGDPTLLLPDLLDIAWRSSDSSTVPASHLKLAITQYIDPVLWSFLKRLFCVFSAGSN